MLNRPVVKVTLLMMAAFVLLAAVACSMIKPKTEEVSEPTRNEETPPSVVEVSLPDQLKEVDLLAEFLTGSCQSIWTESSPSKDTMETVKETLTLPYEVYADTELFLVVSCPGGEELRLDFYPDSKVLQAITLSDPKMTVEMLTSKLGTPDLVYQELMGDDGEAGDATLLFGYYFEYGMGFIIYLGENPHPSINDGVYDLVRFDRDSLVSIINIIEEETPVEWKVAD